MREGLVLFTYLHLAADKPLTEELINRKVTGIAYETVQLPSGGLPLLYPMSEVAGCLAPQVGAHSLLKAQGGRGVLMGGVGGVANAKVVIIGAGVSGPERRQHRARHGCRRHAARHRPRQAADVVLALQQPGARAGVVQAGDRAAGDRGRHGDRRGADPRCRGAQAGQQRAGLADEAGLGAGRHRGRPGRLLRGHPRHDPLGPDVPGPRLDLLLRRQHARRGAQHLDLRADQRDHAVRRRAGHQGLGAGLPRRPQPRARASTPTPASSPTSRWARPSASTRSARTRCWRRHRDRGAAGRRDELARAVRTYLDHLAVERGLAVNTLSSYRRDLRRYLEHLDRPGRRRASTRSPRRPWPASWSRCARATPTTRRSARRRRPGPWWRCAGSTSSRSPTGWPPTTRPAG